MDKKVILAALTERLKESLSVTELGRRTASADAIEAEGAMQSRYSSSKEENQTLEQAYILKRRRLEDSLRILANVVVSNTVHDTVRLHSLVEANIGGETRYCFVTTVGGEQVKTKDDHDVDVVSKDSPFAKCIWNKKKDDKFTLPNGVIGKIITIQ